MEYKLNMGAWSSVFAVPSVVVDQHIKLCSGVSLKVLVLILRSPDEPVDLKKLSQYLGLSTGDICDALNFWIEAGVLFSSEGSTDASPLSLTPSRPVASVPDAPLAEAVKNNISPPVQLAGKPRYSREEVHKIIDGDRVLSELIQAAQTILGKPLTSVDMDIMVALYSYYSLSGHYIMTVIQYCASIGKDSMRYIEKTAASWLDEGIDNLTVDEHVKLLAQRRSREGGVKRIFGIGDRNLVDKEQRYLSRWFEEYNFDENMISIAYERTIENIGKLSFAYINTILESWYKKGILTPKAAAEEQALPRPKGDAKTGASYDIDKLTRMIEAEYAIK